MIVTRLYYLSYCTKHDDGFLYECSLPSNACCPQTSDWSLIAMVGLDIDTDTNTIVGARDFPVAALFSGGWTRMMFLYAVYGAGGQRIRYNVPEVVPFTERNQ